MTRTMLFFCAALAATPIAAEANAAATANVEATANVGAAFGNTVLTVDPDGRTRSIWLKPDGSWTGRSRRGLELAGSWKVKGEKVCLSQSKPKLLGSMCQTFPTDPAVGIETKDPMGKMVRLKLVKGHVVK